MTTNLLPEILKIAPPPKVGHAIKWAPEAKVMCKRYPVWMAWILFLFFLNDFHLLAKIPVQVSNKGTFIVVIFLKHFLEQFLKPSNFIDLFSKY